MPVRGAPSGVNNNKRADTGRRTWTEPLALMGSGGAARNQRRLGDVGASGRNGQKRAAAAAAAAARAHLTNRYSPFRVCDDECDCCCHGRRSCVCLCVCVYASLCCVCGVPTSAGTARLECAVCAYVPGACVQYMRVHALAQHATRRDATLGFLGPMEREWGDDDCVDVGSRVARDCARPCVRFYTDTLTQAK